jgi:hypothetical protein
MAVTAGITSPVSMRADAMCMAAGNVSLDD